MLEVPCLLLKENSIFSQLAKSVDAGYTLSETLDNLDNLTGIKP